MSTLSAQLIALMSLSGLDGWLEIFDKSIIPQDFINILEKLTTTKQLEQVRLAIESRLSYEQISIFAKPEFGGKKIAQMRTGFEYGLSIEQVKVYARPELNVLQMKHIKLALVASLSIQQVKQYAKPTVHFTEVAQLHKKCLPYNILVKEHFV